MSIISFTDLAKEWVIYLVENNPKVYYSSLFLTCRSLFNLINSLKKSVSLEDIWDGKEFVIMPWFTDTVDNDGKIIAAVHGTMDKNYKINYDYIININNETWWSTRYCKIKCDGQAQTWAWWVNRPFELHINNGRAKQITIGLLPHDNGNNYVVYFGPKIINIISNFTHYTDYKPSYIACETVNKKPFIMDFEFYFKFDNLDDLFHVSVIWSIKKQKSKYRDLDNSDELPDDVLDMINGMFNDLDLVRSWLKDTIFEKAV